jgi:hypothetical protein
MRKEVKKWWSSRTVVTTFVIFGARQLCVQQLKASFATFIVFVPVSTIDNTNFPSFELLKPANKVAKLGV